MNNLLPALVTVLIVMVAIVWVFKYHELPSEKRPPATAHELLERDVKPVKGSYYRVERDGNVETYKFTGRLVKVGTTGYLSKQNLENADSVMRVT